MLHFYLNAESVESTFDLVEDTHGLTVWRMTQRISCFGNLKVIFRFRSRLRGWQHTGMLTFPPAAKDAVLIPTLFMTAYVVYRIN